MQKRTTHSDQKELTDLSVGRVSSTRPEAWTLSAVGHRPRPRHGHRRSPRSAQVSLASPLGGNAKALWEAFTYLGAACCGLALLYLIKAQTLGAAKLGDTSFLRG